MKSSISPASSTTPAGTITTAYDYGYAADGGRRWRKDYANNVWTWYPCGVACNAGELVEQTSDLTGATWTTSALYLKAGSGCGTGIVRRNSEYHHAGIGGNINLVSGAGAAVLATRISNAFGVQQYASGSAQTPWITNAVSADAEGLQLRANCLLVAERALSVSAVCQVVTPVIPEEDKTCEQLGLPEGTGYKKWRDCTGKRLTDCEGPCGIAGGKVKKCCEVQTAPIHGTDKTIHQSHCECEGVPVRIPGQPTPTPVAAV